MSPMRTIEKVEGGRRKAKAAPLRSAIPETTFEKVVEAFRPRRTVSYFCLLTSALVFAGCTLIETRPDQSKFYVLDAPPVEKPEGKPWTFALAVARVQTPSYLDQVQIVSRTGESRVTFSEFNRWLEPMDKGVTRVFSNALASHLNADRVAVEPALDVYRDGVLVQLQLIRLDGELGEHVTASARWRVSSVHTAETLATGEATIEEPCESREYQAYATSLGRAIDKLSIKVTDSMKTIKAGAEGLPVK